MKIAILGWGSLVWQPKDLKFDKKIGWNNKGPYLPIEFSRISKDGRLTLVIDQSIQSKVQTLYAISLFTNLDEAILDLAVREGSGRKSIGSYNKINNELIPSNFIFKDEIIEWLSTSDCDAAIWTNLSSKWEAKDDQGNILNINPADRIEYLKNLSGGEKTYSEEYIRKAPSQIITHFRIRIELELGWTFIDTN